MCVYQAGNDQLAAVIHDLSTFWKLLDQAVCGTHFIDTAVINQQDAVFKIFRGRDVILAAGIVKKMKNRSPVGNPFMRIF